MFCRGSIRFWFAATIAWISLAAPLRAQQSWGRIQGTVSDYSGAAVPGAYLSAAPAGRADGVATTSDERGWYVFPSLPIGLYTLTVTAPGFRTTQYQRIDVKLGSHTTLHPRLSLGSLVESIEVADSLSALDPTSSQVATNITSGEFERMARGRSFHTILMMSPGVRQEVRSGSAGVGGIQVDGASGSENAYFIDGLEVSDLLTGALHQQSAIPFEFVQEIQVKSGGFEAEFGGATGGVISVATRAGSNAWHGELSMQATGNRLNASDRGYYQRSPVNIDAPEFVTPKQDDYRIFYPGISLGGPLVRDRLQAFASFMPELERTRRTVAYADGERTFSQDRIRQYSLGRLDYAVRPNLKFTLSNVWSPARRNGYLPTRDPRIAPPANDLSALGDFVPAQTFSGAASYSVTPRVLFSLRYGYKYLNSKNNNYGVSQLPYVLYRRSTGALPDIPEGAEGLGGFQNVSGTYAVERDITSRHNLFADTSYVTSIAGQQHILKVGYSLSRVHNDVADGYTNGYFEMYWGDSFSRGPIDGERGRYGYYIWQDGPRRNSRVSGRNHGLYLQDAWRVLPRLTLNLGIRAEAEFLPPYRPVVNGRKVSNPIAFGWPDKLAPRLGAAWDLLGDGKWKISGSYGRFFDVMKYSLARASFGGEYWMSHVYRLDSAEVLSLSRKTPDILGARVTSYDNRSMPINERGELQGIDPGIQPYSSQEITFGLDRQIGSRVELGVRYTRKDLLRVIDDIGVLNAAGSEVYLIGNPGYGLTRDPRSPYGQKTPDGREFLFPRATRQYSGLEFRMQAQTEHFQVLGSYTYSKLYGNYAGLANSDEAGRSDPSISRSFDLPTYYFDSSGSQRNTLGRLATDRPHVFKIFAWHDFRTRLGLSNIGITQLAMSGGLDTTTASYLTATTFPYGRGDLGRMPFFTQSDLNLSHTVHAGERLSVKVEANALNVLNHAAVTSRATQINRQGNITAARLPLSQFFDGYDVRQFVGSGPGQIPYNSIYGLPGVDPVDGGLTEKHNKSDLSSAFLATNPGFGAYQSPRSIRLGIRFIF